MKKRPNILSLLCPFLVWSSVIYSTEEGKKRDFKDLIPLMNLSLDEELAAMLSVEGGDGPFKPHSEFRESFLAAGTRDQYAADLSRGDELRRILEVSRFEKRTRLALEESEFPILELSQKQAITLLKEQIETLSLLSQSLREQHILVSTALVEARSEMNSASEDLDNPQISAEAIRRYDQIDRQLKYLREEMPKVEIELTSLRNKLGEQDEEKAPVLPLWKCNIKCVF